MIVATGDTRLLWYLVPVVVAGMLFAGRLTKQAHDVITRRFNSPRVRKSEVVLAVTAWGGGWHTLG